LALSGQYSSIPEMCRVAIRETDAVTPNPTEAVFYTKAHRIYQSMYPALKPICAEIATLA
jgi:sugar (pentulose or hexulose) kinase